jgi:hypothetical protein
VRLGDASAQAAAVLCDELDPGVLEGLSHGVHDRSNRLALATLEIDDRL